MVQVFRDVITIHGLVFDQADRSAARVGVVGAYVFVVPFEVKPDRSELLAQLARDVVQSGLYAQTDGDGRYALPISVEYFQKLLSSAEVLARKLVKQPGRREGLHESLEGPWTAVAYAFGITAWHTFVVDAETGPDVERDLDLGLDLDICFETEDGKSINTAREGDLVTVKASLGRALKTAVHYSWDLEGGALAQQPDKQDSATVNWDTTGLLGGAYKAELTLSDGEAEITVGKSLLLTQRAVQQVPTVPVTLRRAGIVSTRDLALWAVIRKSAEAMSFSKASYSHFMDMLLCGREVPGPERYDDAVAGFNRLQTKRFLPYSDTDAYRLLKAATEAFVMVSCAVDLDDPDFGVDPEDLEELATRMDSAIPAASLTNLWAHYLERVNGNRNRTLPYLALVLQKLRDVGLEDLIPIGDIDADLPKDCVRILKRKLNQPCLLELIWSYWHEEGMLVQTMNAISRRFQNIRSPGTSDPLANLEIDPLRPLNNLLWGYIQDEQHRLTVLRRAYEYNHHYGLTIQGRAVPELRPADSRSKFLEAFHNLLYVCTIFYKQADDTTVVPDGFPVLNALKEVHLLLSEGAHNQFGDLTSTARIEMLMQQWLLARTEFREFLPTRIMVAYPEAWMDRVDAMKKIQGWTDVSILHFRDLAVFGEQILLGIRYGKWSDINNPVQAANWARFWRPENQGYIHAYRAVTGVDLSAEVTDSQLKALRVMQPSQLMLQRLRSGGQVPALPQPAVQRPVGFRQRRAARRQ